MLRYVLMFLATASLSCDKGQDESVAVMPVATSWNGGGTSVPSGSQSGLAMGGASDPHAGLAMGGASDPHAGLAMGASDPHAGLGMGASNLSQGGLVAPDPQRFVDPSMFLKGEIRSSETTAKRIQPGAILFISVRPYDSKSRSTQGSPLAVDRVELSELPFRFHLTAAQTMVAGTAFQGDVMIYARVDGDGEASTTISGDIEGSVLATIPAAGLSLVLDTIVE